jgi:hypothetical protein
MTTLSLDSGWRNSWSHPEMTDRNKMLNEK